jgi:hypothetical protein
MPFSTYDPSVIFTSANGSARFRRNYGRLNVIPTECCFVLPFSTPNEFHIL